jgi:hypothetical protein
MSEMFTFEHDGETFEIPSALTKYGEVPGRLIRDAYMDGDDGEMRLGFTLLEMVDADPNAIDALYAKPAPEMLDVFRDWMRFRPSEEDATLGESSASSD